MCSIAILQVAIAKVPTSYLHSSTNHASPIATAVTRRRPPPPRCSSQFTDQIQTGRRSGGYQPALWDFDSIQSLHNEYKEEVHRTRSQCLIDQVKMMLLHLHEDEVDDHVRLLELIDELHRLGVSCHFENQIIQILNSICFNYDTYERDDIYSTSLQFRLLRQYGFTISQEVFDCFKNEEGTNFKTSLGQDIKGLLQLYEASFLLTQGENTLELAREFATKFLQKKLDDHDDDEIEDDDLLSSIKSALEFPTHWKVQMPNARSFIDDYKRRPNMNPIVLELAKLEINMVQAQFQEELKETSRWWESTCLVEQLPFVRDRIVECYLWTTGVIQRREHGYERIMLTKINALITTIDDVFDIYGTLEELHLFTTAIQRWDIESMNQLPSYMQLCYLALYNFVNEMAYATLVEKGFNSIPYLRKTWMDLIEAYMTEAKWYNNGYKPSLEEYINNGWISIGGVPILSHIFFRLTDSIDDTHNYKYHDMVRASCTILRLADDMGTSLDEVERGDVPKSIQCYMEEKNASEEEAREHVRSVVEKTWKTMNAEMMMTSGDSPIFSKYFVEAVANLARMAQFIYQDGSDGFGMQHSKVNKLLRGLLFEHYA